MNDMKQTKKWIAVAGCLAVCIMLAVLIGTQLQKKPVADEPFQSQESQQTDVTVKPPQEETKNEVSGTPPDSASPANTDNGAVSTGSEQTIQKDVSKPEYTEEQITDPTQKPNGEKVTEPPKSVDHDKVEKPKDTPKTEKQTQGGDTKDGKIYVPGFGWIDDNGGGGQGTTVDGDGDINKQVGTMD